MFTAKPKELWKSSLLTLLVWFLLAVRPVAAQEFFERFPSYTTTVPDAIPCKDNSGTPITLQSYIPGPIITPSPTVGGIAAVKGTTITVKATFLTGSFQGTVTLNNVLHRGQTIPASMTPVQVNNETIKEFTITVGPLPNYVTLGSLEVNLMTGEIIDND